MSVSKPLLLLILDGWGYSEDEQYNAIMAADTPQWDRWWAKMPHMLLHASGSCVGLPDDQMGNSEVGHVHLGAGRILPQDFTRINDDIEQETFYQHPLLHETLNNLQKHGKALHMMGLISPGGVHSHEAHLFALLKVCQLYPEVPVYLHLFLDGRDTPPKSALASIEQLESMCQDNQIRIASLSGRYYAMDRDQRWERVQPVYQLICDGISEQQFEHADQAILNAYKDNISDEFVPPTRIGRPWQLEDGDALLFFNFRADRARQLSQAFLLDAFDGFQRHRIPKLLRFISMTQYSKDLPLSCLYPPFQPKHTLGEEVSLHGGRQLRIAETEKYAHVTFFFNGGREQPFEREDRVLIPSAKVATYDLKPEMSAPEVTDALVTAIKSEKYDFIVCNFANADMVGHSGHFDATKEAIHCLDRCMQRIGDALKQVGGHMLITADHGNAEKMFDQKSQQAHTAHTSQPVPLLYVGDGFCFTQSYGSLIDVAPTVLRLMNIPIPDEMQGSVLMETHHD